MPGFMPGIHVFFCGQWSSQDVDGRVFLARRRAEPVIGPRFARTRWRFCRAMTILSTGADIHTIDGYINPARHVRAFGVRMGFCNDGIDQIERRAR